MSEIYNHNCNHCPLHETAKRICIPGSGDPHSRAFIVGEAPGANEDEQGIPFVGMSGSVINGALAKAGISREEVFVTNAVKCRPPDNRTPTDFELETCFDYLFKEVDLYNPSVIMTLGNPAMQAVTGEKGGITRKAGLWKKVLGPNSVDHILVIPNYHPAYVLRYRDKQNFFEEVVLDFVSVWRYSVGHTIEETWRYAKP